MSLFVRSVLLVSGLEEEEEEEEEEEPRRHSYRFQLTIPDWNLSTLNGGRGTKSAFSNSHLTHALCRSSREFLVGWTSMGEIIDFACSSVSPLDIALPLLRLLRLLALSFFPLQ